MSALILLLLPFSCFQIFFQFYFFVVLGAHVKKPVDKKKKGTEAVDPSSQAPTIEAQPLTSPLQVKFKIHKNHTSAVNGELSEAQRDTEDGPYIEDDQEELITFVLTEDIFVEILAARLQVKSLEQIFQKDKNKI